MVAVRITQTVSLQLLPLNVHFNSTSLANILSLSEVESHYQVTMDTTFESAFNVHINDHTILKFLKCGTVLYYFDTAKANKSPVNTYSFLSTVKDKNHILVDLKLKERIDLVTYKEKLAGLLYNTTEISLPKIK